MQRGATAAAVADALLSMAHAIWSIVIPRVTRINHDRPTDALSLRDLRFLMLYGEVFFHARAKVAGALLKRSAADDDRMFAIGEAFQLRCDALGQKMYCDFTKQLAGQVNPLFLGMTGADAAAVKRRMRDTIDRLASDTFLSVCCRGTVRSFEWIWSMQRAVAIHTTALAAERLAIGFEQACRNDNLPIARRIYEGDDPTLPDVKLGFRNAMDLACGANSVSVAGWLISMAKAGKNLEMGQFTSLETHFVNACHRGWLEMAKTLASALDPPVAKKLVLDEIRSIAEKGDPKVLEVLEWAVEEFEIPTAEVRDRMIASRFPMWHAAAEPEFRKFSGPACSWLLHYARQHRTGPAEKNSASEKLMTKSNRSAAIGRSQVLERGIDLTRLDAPSARPDALWDERAPVPILIDHRYPAATPIPRDFHVDENIDDVVFSDEEMSPLSSATAPPALNLDYIRDNVSSDEDEPMESPRRLSTYDPETNVGIRGDIVQDVGKLFEKDGDV